MFSTKNAFPSPQNSPNFNRFPPPMRVSRSLAALFLTVVAVAATFVGSGCASVFVPKRLNAADRRFELGSPLGPKRSPSATQTLIARDVPTERLGVAELAKILEKIDANPNPDLIYAYVESAYFEARRQESRRPAIAREIYVSVALYSYHYLFNPALGDLMRGSLFNAQTRDVALLYNASCERLTRLILQDAKSSKKSKNDADFPFKPNRTLVLNGATTSPSLFCRVASGSWRPEEIELFELAADCEVDELAFDCRRSGLGVPLVAKRRAAPNVDRPEERYYPLGLCFPATALLRPNPTKPLGSIPPLQSADSADSADFAENADYPADATAIFEFYDPLVSTLATLEGRVVPLETDLTTPLGHFLTTETELAFTSGKKGLLNPEKLLETVTFSSGETTAERTLQGLYLTEPFDPRKIPVVMSHGLGSSPATWIEMYNSLRNVPEIRDAYQFWFYFYPTGQPFWISAAQLRADLRTLRTTLDPNRDAPTLDQIVLIGHSMGGLVSRMQVASSGDRIWRKISSVPLDELDFDAETKENLRDWFFFEPNPSVRRVVTVATPFEGSEFANGFTEWLADGAISLPKTVVSVLASLATSPPEQIDDPTLLETKTSVESLSPKSPIFAALDECPIPENVALNNVVGVLPSLEKRWLNPKKSDGIVEFWSSGRDDVESQREVPASHMYVHTHPAAIFETKEILLRHLDAARSELGIAPIGVSDQNALRVKSSDFNDFNDFNVGAKKSAVPTPPRRVVDSRSIYAAPTDEPSPTAALY